MAERHVSGELLSAFLDDEVDDATAAKLVAHVVSCPGCERELTGLRAMRDALHSLPALQAPVLTARMVRRTQRLRALARTARLVAAAAFVPMVVLVTAYLLGAEVGGTEPTVDVFLVEHLGRTGGGTFPAILGDAP